MMVATRPLDVETDFSVLFDHAASLLTAYDDEVKALPYVHWWMLDPRKFDAGRAILESSIECQALIAAQLLEANFGRREISGRPWWSNDNQEDQIQAGHNGVLRQLLRRKLPFSEITLCRLARQFATCTSSMTFSVWLRPFVRSVELWTGQHPLSPELMRELTALRVTSESHVDLVESRQATERLDVLLGGMKTPAGQIDTSDDWGMLADSALAALPLNLRVAWGRVLAHAGTAKGTKPALAWQRQAQAILSAIEDQAGTTGQMLLRDWLGLLSQPAPVRPPRAFTPGVRRSIMGDPVPTSVISARNGDLLRGLAWCCAAYNDAETASALGDAAVACFKKIPDVGARSAKAGNACVYALGQMSGLNGVAQLQRLRQRVKQRSAIAIIDATLDAAARREGMSREDLDDLGVPSFDLIDGRQSMQFGDYNAEIVVVGTQQVAIEWFGADGQPRKSEPASVKREFPDQVKAFKKIADDIRTILPIQRDRIERLLLTQRTWAFADWQTRYLDHPLLGLIARRLIWRFDESDVGAWLDGKIVTVEGQVLDPGPTTRVQLWHPIDADVATVVAWQDWLDRHQITQPFKQAHREIYVLTEAERTTDVYSNRFAGHLLRQHQFATLARQRDWTYRLQGGFDGSNTPTIDLPVHQLSAEFWVEPIDGGDEAYTPSGISVLVSTDQVRFRRTDASQPLSLTDIPPLVFSELMRDVDLFVAVCSIGTDPLWGDRGLQPHYGYWERTAFSDELSASAQTRRIVLDRLVPRLKIASRCQLDGKFLVVRGDLRTYKIHLGSGNILMEPNNQYLCIVPSRGATKDPAQGLFLPFEGDALLSVILSKAFLLADDTTITDPTIVRQIR